MSRLTDAINKGMTFIESEMNNQTFTWNNQSYVCVPSDPKITSVVKQGAWVNVKLATLTVRTNLFPNGYPEGFDYVTFRNQRWTITAVDQTGTEGLIVLTIVEDNKGVYGA